MTARLCVSEYWLHAMAAERTFWTSKKVPILWDCFNWQCFSNLFLASSSLFDQSILSICTGIWTFWISGKTNHVNEGQRKCLLFKGCCLTLLWLAVFQQPFSCLVIAIYTSLFFLSIWYWNMDSLLLAGALMVFLCGKLSFVLLYFFFFILGN